MREKKPVNKELQTERRNEIVKTLKSFIAPGIFALIIFGLIYFVIHYQNIEAPEEIIPVHSYTGDEKPVVMENDRLIFTMDPVTTQFTVEVKDTHKIWRSNPENAMNDATALSEEKNKLMSPLLMSYAVETGLETSFNTYAQSTQNGIYEITQGDN
ncbi:MAG: hypothetical protein IJT34_00560, partial [Butyrivibrio sp.]|nr:hypothetical protein [Butyrivibrio sp.]